MSMSVDASQQSWYFTNYPFLQNFPFPPPMETLKDFYIADMNNRNLTPEDVYLNDYDLLFSYFLYNYPLQNDPNRFKAKSWLENTIDNLPKAISMTFSQVGTAISKTIPDLLGIPLWLLIVIIVAVIFLIKKYL